eukprot:353827-Rhodomonas_salina.1
MLAAAAATELLLEAEQAGLADGRTYTRLISALHREGRSEDAARIFERSQLLGLNRGAENYEEVLRRVESSARTKRLQAAMERSPQEGMRMFEELLRNGTADAFAYNVAIEHSQVARVR